MLTINSINCGIQTIQCVNYYHPGNLTKCCGNDCVSIPFKFKSRTAFPVSSFIRKYRHQYGSLVYPLKYAHGRIFLCYVGVEPSIRSGCIWFMRLYSSGVGLLNLFIPYSRIFTKILFPIEYHDRIWRVSNMEVIQRTRQVFLVKYKISLHHITSHTTAHHIKHQIICDIISSPCILHQHHITSTYQLTGKLTNGALVQWNLSITTT